MSETLGQLLKYSGQYRNEVIGIGINDIWPACVIHTRPTPNHPVGVASATFEKSEMSILDLAGMVERDPEPPDDDPPHWHWHSECAMNQFF